MRRFLAKTADGTQAVTQRKERIVWASAIGVILAGVIGWYISGGDGIQVVESVVSLLGVPIGIYATLTVRELRQRYLRHVLLSDGLRRLKIERTRIDATLRDKDWEAARQTLGRVHGLIEAISAGVPARTDVQPLLTDLDAVLKVDRRSFERKANDFLPLLERHLALLELRVLEVEWGGHDD